MHEAVLGIEHPGAYADATAGTDTTVELWCNDHCDLLHVGGDGGEAVVAHVEATVGVRERVAEGDERLLITDECLKERDDDPIEATLADHDCLLVPPLRYAEGRKWCRVLALDPANLTGFYRDMAAEFPVTVERKREVGPVSARGPPHALDSVLPTRALDAALPDLSTRQREALLTAVEMGYYRIPRERTTAELAVAMGVERRTFEEHLRRAENKVVAVLAEYL